MKFTLAAASCALLAILPAQSFAQTLNLSVTSAPSSPLITISAFISNAPDLGGGSFVLQYNSTLARLNNSAMGALLTSARVTSFSASPTASNTEMVTFGGGSTVTSGTGSLADFTFTPSPFGGTAMFTLVSTSNFTTTSGAPININLGRPISVALPMASNVPEPGTSALALSALCGGLFALRMRRKPGKPAPEGR